jgi:hypothetical protein
MKWQEIVQLLGAVRGVALPSSTLSKPADDWVQNQPTDV